MIISRSVLLRMRTASDKMQRKLTHTYTHFMFNFHPPPSPPENLALNEIMWGEKMLEPDKPRMTI